MLQYVPKALKHAGLWALDVGCLAFLGKNTVKDVSNVLVTKTVWTRTVMAGKRAASPSAARPWEVWWAPGALLGSHDPSFPPSTEVVGCVMRPQPGFGSRSEQLNF